MERIAMTLIEKMRWCPLREIVLLLICTGSLVFGPQLRAEDAVANGTEIQHRGELILIIGSPGTGEYKAMFSAWADQWEAAAKQGTLNVQRIDGQDGATLQSIEAAIAELVETDANSQASSPAWIVFIGHGTDDGRSSKFNLSGPDLSAVQLQELLAKVHRPVAIVNCSSASGPFLSALSRENRVVVTATRTGSEVNFARFGKYLAESLMDPSADYDKDDQVSLLEAFLIASKRTEEYYVSDGQLATEHALLDDNGDQRGTRATAFRGIRVIATPQDEGTLLDGLRAHQWHLIPNSIDQQLSPEALQRRNQLEIELATLRTLKGTMDENEYFATLESICVELAELNEVVDAE